MIEYLSALFFIFSQNLGLHSDPNFNWHVLEGWNSKSGYYSFSAQLKSNICQSVDENIQFPQVIHGVHSLFVNNKLVYKSGDENFKIATPFYYSPSVSCSLLQNRSEKDEVVWRVQTYSAFFARFEHFPKLASKNELSSFFDLQLNLVASGLLFFIMLFSIVVFRRKIPIDQIISMSFASIGLGLYALFCVNSYILIPVSMLSAHKIADIFLSLGCQFYLYIFYKNKILDSRIFAINIFSLILFLPLIILGTNGDIVQLGTTLQMPFVFLGFLNIALDSVKKINFSKLNSGQSIELFSVLFFIFCGLNDIFRIFGLIDSHMILPLGAVGGVFFLAAAVNRDIEKTYFERDDLLLNLQQKVDAQTLHLSQTLEQLKKSQADLVQSSRLASLGTLSAGIAHEINNAINYVNGSIVPLEKRVLKYIPESDLKSVTALFSAMKQGAQLTVEIVKSLRQFTGLNQAHIKDVNLSELVQSVLTILKSKIQNLEVKIDIDKSLSVHCYQVGMNQIVMNLITNAIDVVPRPNGQIQIQAKCNEDVVEFSVQDNGCGMNDDIKKKIFDPFFTTKDVGQGTGLGLHIVAKEVERLKGKIEVLSQQGKGSTFVIRFPREQNQIVLNEKLKGAA